MSGEVAALPLIGFCSKGWNSEDKMLALIFFLHFQLGSIDSAWNAHV